MGSLTEKVREGDYLILDAGKGTVCVNPPGEERETAEKRQAEAPEDGGRFTGGEIFVHEAESFVAVIGA